MAQSNGEHRASAAVVVWMTGALLCFAVAAISIRTLGAGMGVFEINVVRTGGGLFVVLLLVLARDRLLAELRPADAIAHLPRNLAHATGGILWTTAITLLPLATVFSLEFTAPAFAAVLGLLILGERVPRRGWIGIAVSLVGVVVILRPDPATFSTTSLLPVGAAFFFALTAVLTRGLVRHRSVFSIVFWMMIIQLPIYTIGAVLVPGAPAEGFLLAPSTLLAMVALALAGLGSQYCLARALAAGTVGSVFAIDFLRVPLIAFVGVVAYGETIDVWVFAGFALIVFGILYGLARDGSNARSARTDA
jgi:drug/metabolite transporter (DMT)-like permease